MPRSEFHQFLYNNLLRAGIWLLLVVVMIILWNRFVPDDFLTWIKVYTSNPIPIYVVFLTSETIVGILPPELFVGWALSFEDIGYITNVAFLAVISYTAGLLAYFMGRWLRRFRFVQLRMRSKKVRKYVHYYQRWGGLLIIISAITPVPFATVSLISGTFKFSIWKYLVYSASRFARFALIAYIVFKAGTI